MRVPEPNAEPCLIRGSRPRFGARDYCWLCLNAETDELMKEFGERELDGPE